MYDVIIIGAGPGGMAAAIYAGRARLNTLLIEKEFPGGQVIKTYEVANYPGIASVIGPDLAIRMQEHAKAYAIEPLLEEVVDIDLTQKIKKVITQNGNYETKSVIIATGSKWRKLGVEGEESFAGKGVSYCATCDGAFFRDQTVAVVGGGNTAVEDALFLSRLCKKVYVIHRRDTFTAERIMIDKLLKAENVAILYNATIEVINGDTTVKSIVVSQSGDLKTIDVNGVFVAIGMLPHTELVKGKIALNDSGYIITNADLQTNVEGVYAAGDVRDKKLRQIITACSDGALALYAAEKYILENF
ncbi:MAG: thioredoxin-disulfide reductase [Cellulosilyticaceae bacterium]